jgi:hypothetical protein
MAIKPNRIISHQQIWRTSTVGDVHSFKGYGPLSFLSEGLAKLLIHLNDTTPLAISLELNILLSAIETGRLRGARIRE